MDTASLVHLFQSEKEAYFSSAGCPVLSLDNFLERSWYETLYKELQSIPMEAYDRYENPFEKKFTLRKDKFPASVVRFLEYLQSKEFLSCVQQLYPNAKISIDTRKHYWGVHKYGQGDTLDMHCDAGIYPFDTTKAKFLTLGLYANAYWDESLGGQFEIWSGDSLREETPLVHSCVRKVGTYANRFLMFENSEFAWHGAPEPYKGDIHTNPRYFVTVSLLLDIEHQSQHHNQRKRAYFARHKDQEDTPFLENLRRRRADNTECQTAYRV